MPPVRWLHPQEEFSFFFSRNCCADYRLCLVNHQRLNPPGYLFNCCRLVVCCSVPFASHLCRLALAPANSKGASRISALNRSLHPMGILVWAKTIILAEPNTRKTGDKGSLGSRITIPLDRIYSK